MVIQTETDIVLVRQATREAALAAGFSLVQQTKLVTAASELARNALVYGGGGKAEIEVEETAQTGTVWLTFIDSGPGIPDIERALTDGYTTGSGLGLGLGGARRLADRFHIESAPGQGTVIKLAISTRRKT
ncbi:MAG TPA: ATP-binding protein [Amycolatopsis sp.]|nr:ATP-binding protein [Amycolatopsis sp.]HVV14742.1 ATP-binding protein [Amycolatopsis sp.]